MCVCILGKGDPGKKGFLTRVDFEEEDIGKVFFLSVRLSGGRGREPSIGLPRKSSHGRKKFKNRKEAPLFQREENEAGYGKKRIYENYVHAVQKWL